MASHHLHVTTNLIVIQKVVRGEHPERPEGTRFTDDLWRSVGVCWWFQPRDRPTLELEAVLEQVIGPASGGTRDIHRRYRHSTQPTYPTCGSTVPSKKSDIISSRVSGALSDSISWAAKRADILSLGLLEHELNHHST